MELEQKIEGLLFYKAEPLSYKRLADLLGAEEDAIRAAAKRLEAKLTDRGVRLIMKDDEVVLATAAELSVLIEAVAKEELSRDLGKAGLETLSIVLYKGPISRSEIDYIRGVNSNFILRNLLIRGLIEKVPNPKDQRGFLYRPTFELLSYIGLTKAEDLPEYHDVGKELHKATEDTVEPHAT